MGSAKPGDIRGGRTPYLHGVVPRKPAASKVIRKGAEMHGNPIAERNGKGNGHHKYTVWTIKYTVLRIKSHVMTFKSHVLAIKYTVLLIRSHVVSVKSYVLGIKFTVFPCKYTVLKLKYTVLTIRYTIVSVKYTVLTIRSYVLRIKAYDLSIKSYVLPIKSTVFACRYAVFLCSTVYLPCSNRVGLGRTSFRTMRGQPHIRKLSVHGYNPSLMAFCTNARLDRTSNLANSAWRWSSTVRVLMPSASAICGRV